MICYLLFAIFYCGRASGESASRRLGKVNFTEDTHHNRIFHSKGLKGHEEQTFEQEEKGGFDLSSAER